MKLDELRTKYETAWRIIHAEQLKREYIFRNAPEQQQRVMAEMDELMAIITEFKNELKRHAEDAPAHQPKLLDTPRQYP